MLQNIQSARLLLDERGRISLPAKLRSELGWKLGEKLILTRESDGSIRIVSISDQIDEMRGILADKRTGRSLATELISERRREAAKEA